MLLLKLVQYRDLKKKHIQLQWIRYIKLFQYYSEVRCVFTLNQFTNSYCQSRIGSTELSEKNKEPTNLEMETLAGPLLFKYH